MDKQFFDDHFEDDNYDDYDDASARSRKSGKTFTKGFLTALAICMVAIGASVWTTVKNVRSYLYPDVELPLSSDTDCDISSETHSTLASYVVESDVPVNAEVSGVKKSDDNKVVFTYSPVSSKKIINEYSEDPVYNETLSDYRAHPAVDYKADIDDKVRTMGMGVVKKIYYDDLLGYVVVVEHSSNVESYYCGLAKTTFVQTGEVLNAGDFIGTVYSIPCETSLKPHVHVAVKENGVWVNPDKFMKSNEN